jgi:hypothetical protein
MNSVAAQEKRRLECKQGHLNMAREADSMNLINLCGAIATWASEQDTKVYMPQSANKNTKSTKVEIIKGKEIRANPPVHELIESGDEALFGLLEQVPSLAEGQRATATDVDMHRNHKGEHFLALVFDEDDAGMLGNERADVWESLGKITGEGLEWRDYNPDLMLAYFRPGSISQRESVLLGKVAKGLLPMAIDLSPAQMPSAYQLSQPS